MTPDDAPVRLRTLHETEGVWLARFDHPQGATLTDTEEQAPELFQINIVEQGYFQLRYGRSDYTLGPGSIFLARPGESYRYGHFHDAEPDVCISINFRSELAGEVADILRRLALVLPLTNRLRYLWLQLQHSAKADPFGVESVACEVVDAAERAREGCHLYRSQQLRWYSERIHAAREVMDHDVARPHSLYQLSSAVAMSPFVFARVFRELIGVPPHQYLLRRRMQRARSLLESGMTVTDTCYEVGFNNPAHFTRSYRRHFGTLPSAVTSSARSET